ncbi:MAG: hypothetical protein OXG79_12545 [Chloroflexi bacterium]|nr:hypothetical protein [Chloroflexota bacterium]
MSLTMLTIGERQYVSYASVAEADNYLAVDPAYMATWNALDDDAKGRDLIAATRHLDTLLWAGTKTSTAQVNEWPRSGLVERDGDTVRSNSIPVQLEQATALLAAAVARDPYLFERDASDGDVQSERIGPKAVTYFHRKTDRLVRRVGNARALELIRQWLAGATPAAPVVTGTGDKSSFVPLDRYGRNKGVA